MATVIPHELRLFYRHLDVVTSELHSLNPPHMQKAMLNAGVRTPITSLQYFSDIVEEVCESAIPESYWEPLRAKLTRMEQQWQKAIPARP